MAHLIFAVLALGNYETACSGSSHITQGLKARFLGPDSLGYKSWLHHLLCVIIQVT